MRVVPMQQPAHILRGCRFGGGSSQFGHGYLSDREDPCEGQRGVKCGEIGKPDVTF